MSRETEKTPKPTPVPVERQRPLHTLKSAWKLGWPMFRPRRREPARPEPVAG